MSDLAVGIVGAGNRGESHAERYDDAGASIVAVADIDEEKQAALADAFGATGYGDFRDMFEDADLDVVSVCVHNNLHAPVSIRALERDLDVFCEKPIAATYADASAMMDAAAESDGRLGVQNTNIYDPETTAAKRLIEEGELGDPYFARAVTVRRRGRPYVDGYGTPSFVQSDTAGGGPVIDIGTYRVGRMLYLLGNPDVERVVGDTFAFTDEAYDDALTGGDADLYGERVSSAGYDVEDSGLGYATLADGTVLTLRAAWHMFADDDPELVVGSRGGVKLDPFEFRTTMADYEATASLDVGEFERRRGLIEGGTGYDISRSDDPVKNWVAELRGEREPVPTGEIAYNSMLILEGIYRSAEAGEELSREEIAAQSESTAVEL